MTSSISPLILKGASLQRPSGRCCRKCHPDITILTWGAALRTFSHDYLDTVDRKSTFIIVGDARNNYNDPNLELFRNITRRSRSTIWLNPEAVPLWGTGDSDMLKYAPLCQRTFQVSNLAQLAEAIDTC